MRQGNPKSGRDTELVLPRDRTLCGARLKGSPQRAPWRSAVGICPELTDGELVTLAMMQAMLAFTSEARWLRHARSHLRHLFP